MREPLRTGLWFVPSLFAVGAAAAALGTVEVDRHLDVAPTWLAFNGGPSSAVFTITVMALQPASSQFWPRILRTFLRDRGSQVVLGVFTSTFMYDSGLGNEEES